MTTKLIKKDGQERYIYIFNEAYIICGGNSRYFLMCANLNKSTHIM